jgi:putative membrane protein
MMTYGGGMGWMMAFGLVFWVALVGLAGWALGRYLREGRPRAAGPETPLQVLERRYAEGAIDSAEFDEARARIREDGPR